MVKIQWDARTHTHGRTCQTHNNSSRLQDGARRHQVTIYGVCRWCTVVNATFKYDEPRLKMSYEGQPRSFSTDSHHIWMSHERSCFICFVVWPTTHTHTRLTALFQGPPRWAGTRKVKPIWILLKQETVSGSGISWAMCKSAPCSR